MTTTQKKVHDERIERALAKSEARFRRVVEAAPNAMVMIGDGGQIEMVNAQAELVFGYPRSEMLGQPVEMLVPMRFRKHHPGLRRLFFEDPKSRPMGAGRDLYGLRKDGSEFPVEIGLNPIETEDGAMVLSAIVDISDRKSKERRIEAALKEKEVLLGEVHHRVKNNLQIIHSLLYLQAAKINDATLSSLLKESQNRIKSMALIHQTLYESKDFARVEFGLFLDTLVPTLVSSYAIDAGQAALSIDAAGVSLPISAAIPCGLIVNELISNALKHAFPEGRAGVITVNLRNESLREIILTVSDDGVGFPEAFDIQQSTTLGLQLVRLLADQLGAELTVSRSAPTRFQVRFTVDS
ncbi:MAG TPA: histidine kinase dimerization/phosphoacceptor domain -containing protein [Caulobacteraceae bacterium]|jgi:PAS domain S-box-containing protein|nr:histidine kinase dimerization/phosphoacceptor domain -containing protein [Caulobacteraceae bacterium]